MFWKDDYDCESCNPYMQDTFTEGKCRPNAAMSSYSNDSNKACKDTCGPYLQLFANIFQFFFIAFTLIMIHKYSRKVAYLLCVLTIAGLTAINYLIVVHYNINAYYFYDRNYDRMLNNRPWFRLPSFLIGVLLSLIVSRIHSARYKVEFTIFKQIFMQSFGIGLIIASVYILGFNFIGQNYEPIRHFYQIGSFSIFESALYTSLSPLVFNIGLILLLLPSLLYINQSNKPQNLKVDLNSLLMYDGWRILFKISQAAYICS
jgi:hypothetical protein